MTTISNRLMQWGYIEGQFTCFIAECEKRKEIGIMKDITKEQVEDLLEEAKSSETIDVFLSTFIAGECGLFAEALDQFFSVFKIPRTILAAMDQDNKAIHYIVEVETNKGKRYVDGSGIYKDINTITSRYEIPIVSCVEVDPNENVNLHEKHVETYQWAMDLCDSDDLLIEGECDTQSIFNGENMHYTEVFEIFAFQLAQMLFVKLQK